MPYFTSLLSFETVQYVFMTVETGLKSVVNCSINKKSSIFKNAKCIVVSKFANIVILGVIGDKCFFYCLMKNKSWVDSFPHFFSLAGIITLSKLNV